MPHRFSPLLSRSALVLRVAERDMSRTLLQLMSVVLELIGLPLMVTKGRT